MAVAVLRRLPAALIVTIVAMWVITTVAERAWVASDRTEGPDTIALAGSSRTPAPSTVNIDAHNLPYPTVPTCAATGEIRQWHFVLNKFVDGTPKGTLYATTSTGRVLSAGAYYPSGSDQATQHFLVYTAPTVTLQSAYATIQAPNPNAQLQLSDVSCVPSSYAKI